MNVEHSTSSVEQDERFMCPCGCNRNWIDPRVVELHRAIEKEVGETIPVTSGYRCEAHNSDPDVGGSPTSSHLKGLAWDIVCKRSRLRYRIIAAAIRLGITRIGPKADFIHLDIDRKKAPKVLWL